MAKKHYCKECQNLIEEGKEIKFHKGTNFSSSRYSSGPRDYFTYYLCPKCYQQQQEEARAKNQKISRQVGWSLLVVSLVLIVVIILFFVYQSHQDKKIDRITKKFPKK